jgi:hypothetical protein
MGDIENIVAESAVYSNDEMPSPSKNNIERENPSAKE